MVGIIEDVRNDARGFKVWTIENFYEFPDKILALGDVILDSEHGAVLTAGGVLQLTGAGKIGKSMLLLNVAYGLALGRDALSFKIDKPRRVLYLNGENSPGTMQERLRCLRGYYCIDNEDADRVRQNLLFTSTGLMLPRNEAVKEMRGNLAEIRPEILILDPLKNFFSGEENSADNMREFMGSVRKLMAEFSLTVIIVHHTGKRQHENNLYSGRGSSVLGDDAETTASFQKDAGEKGRFTLSVTGRNCDEFTFHLVRQPDRWFLYSLADAPEPRQDHTLIEILDGLPDEFRTGQFYEATERKGLSDSTAKRRLADAREMGLIEVVVRGVYRKGSDGSYPKGNDPLTRNGSEGSAGSNDPFEPTGTSGVLLDDDVRELF